MQDCVKMFIKCGLTITDLHEPFPTDEQAVAAVGIARMQKIPIFMFGELMSVHKVMYNDLCYFSIRIYNREGDIQSW